MTPLSTGSSLGLGALWLALSGTLSSACTPLQANPQPAPTSQRRGPPRHPGPAAQDSPTPKAKASPGKQELGLSPHARTEDERNTMAIFKRAAPATVFVTQSQVLQDMWTRRTQSVPTGSGTGFVWDSNGHIVTNAHVVSEQQRRRGSRGTRFEVTLFGGKRYPARLVGMAEKKDLAVLKIDAPSAELKAIALAPPAAKLAVGQKTVAIGNPFGLDHTLTTGVVSALNREVVGFGGVSIRDMIQTDASINPGNSGGPLLNSAGQLIGINTMIYSKSGSSAGIGFAVPVSTVRRLVPQLITYGEPRQVGLGVSLAQDSFARRMGVRGVIVLKTASQGPAARAGIRSVQRDRRGGDVYFDVIESIDDVAIRSFDDLYNALESRAPGDKVKVGILRGRQRLSVQVALAVIADLDQK